MEGELPEGKPLTQGDVSRSKADSNNIEPDRTRQSIHKNKMARTEELEDLSSGPSIHVAGSQPHLTTVQGNITLSSGLLRSTGTNSHLA